MAAPWAEGQHKVVVEFKKGTGGAGSRAILLTRPPGSPLPPQLQGRVDPNAWAAFLQEVQQLAGTHPYVVAPSASRVCGWAGGAVMGAVLGFCCVNPDGGDYGVWLPQVDALVSRWAPTFAGGGVALSLQRAQMGYWLQLDVGAGMPEAAHAPAKLV